MRTAAVVLAAVVAVLAACGSRKGGPSADFKADMDTFCGAIDEGPMETIADLGPRILERIRTDEFKRLFDMKREDPTGALFDRLDASVKRVGRTTCPTLEWMRNGMRRPEPKAAPTPP